MRNRKGWVRLIEILLAAVLVFVFFAFIQNAQLSQYSEPPKWDAATLKTMGEDTLRTMDLRDDLNPNNQSDLRDCIVFGGVPSWCSNGIKGSLPNNIGYALFQLDTFFAEAQIAGSGLPQARETVSAHYIIAGAQGEPCATDGPCAVKLVLWYTS